LDTALAQIGKISHKLPLEVLTDIEKRCTDWMASGGGADDPYIHAQLTYAQRFTAGEPVQ